MIFFAIFTIIMLMIIPTVFTLGLCLIPLVCLFIPVIWAVYVVIEQANIALVVENVGIFEALRRGWRVVRDNIGSMIVMSFILILGVSLIGGIIIGLPFFIVSAPAFIGAIAGTNEALRSGMLISGLLFLVYLPFLLFLSGILRSYTSSAWTLTYLRLTTKSSQSLIDPYNLAEDIGETPAQII
jgi:hypothetical protein